MSKPPPSLDYSTLMPTRDYLQDIAKIIGKVQQLFLPAHPYDWQKGLIVTKEGLSTQEFEIQGQVLAIALDFKHRKLSIRDGTSLALRMPAHDILVQMQQWLIEKSSTKIIPSPEFQTTNYLCDSDQAHRLVIVFNWVTHLFGKFKQRNLSPVKSSPILIYPHHFDISLVQYPIAAVSPELKQLAFGFSTGDGIINEPYFYITAYPEPPNFHAVTLPTPAFWQIKGFKGAVLKYQDIISADQPGSIANNFLTSIGPNEWA